MTWTWARIGPMKLVPFSNIRESLKESIVDDIRRRDDRARVRRSIPSAS